MKINLLSLLLIPVGFLSSCIHRPDTVFYSNQNPREVAAIPLNGGESKRIRTGYTKGLVFNQKQKSAAVINVSMTQYNGVELGRIKREWVAVALFVFAPPLN